MYYDSNNNIIISRLPHNLVKPDGSLFINFDKESDSVISSYGYYKIVSDNNNPPTELSFENVSNRQITIDGNNAIIYRDWLELPR